MNATPQTAIEPLPASDLFAGVLALLARIASEHERASLSLEPKGMIRALHADEIIEAKRLHDALSPANAEPCHGRDKT